MFDEEIVLALLADRPTLVEREARLLVGDHLHVAAAAYSLELTRRLIKLHGIVSASNRRGAQPLHYAADGAPGSGHWNPRAQARVIRALVEAGADPNAVDKNGVSPLHRAIRTRCSSAVEALIDCGADVIQRNGSGSRHFVAQRCR